MPTHPKCDCLHETRFHTGGKGRCHIMSCTCKQVSKTEEIPEEPATPPPNYTICNARKMDIYGEDAKIEICLKEKKHKDGHEFVLAPYLFKQIIGRINGK